MIYLIAFLIFAILAALAVKSGKGGTAKAWLRVPRGRTLDDAMKELADKARALARKEHKLDLTHDRASVKDLEDQILDDLHQNQLIAAYPDEELTEMSQLWGAYIGEALRRIRPGEWRPKSKHDGRRPMPFVLDRNAEVFPCAWVYRRIKHGPDYCVHAKAREFADNRDNPRYALLGIE